MTFNDRETIRRGPYAYLRPEDPALATPVPSYPFSPLLPPAISNLSVRAEAGLGDHALITGFVLSGDAVTDNRLTQSILLRGIGPAEIAMVRQTVQSTQAPLRIIMTPIITDFLARGKTPEQAMLEIDEWRQGNSPRVLVDRHFKLMMDGAIFSGLAQMGPPGYIDGHEGLWMAPPEVTAAWARVFWKAGYKLHAHTNGDKSAAAFIDLLRQLQADYPRVDHRFTLEHFAYSTEDQSRQLKALGAVVSANPYYHYLLSDIYSELWLGEDRGSQMVRLGSLERNGVPFALHSDSPMAPLSPLTLAYNASNRVTINGKLSAPRERISLDAALRAITINAAWIMGWEDEIGSIRAGKRADFTVLDADPYEVGAGKVREIPIWGTVFEGALYPIQVTD